MVSWKQNFKPSEIAQVASYVLSLQGTIPANPKAPEGDVWVDESASAPTPAETTSTEVDSLSVTVPAQ